MVDREMMEMVIEDEKKAWDLWKRKKETKERLSDEYFSLKFNIAEGATLYLSDGKQIQFSKFVEWDGDLEKRPRVLGREILPFGVSKKSKIFVDWMTLDEMDAKVNGNKH